MEEDKRRISRIPGALTVSLTICDAVTNEKVAGPLNADLKDVTPLGVGVCLDQVLFENNHFFYAVFDSDLLSLFLEFSLPDESVEKQIIHVKPIWFNRNDDRNAHLFQMGLEFVHGTDSKLIETLMGVFFGETGTRRGGFQNLMDKVKNVFNK
ncbi:MAG: hypothetical protein KKE17_04665 [Proteobacteria bacterium]|nr:hypothetical protein [Pseudomonadota bacterium]MBU1709280.1 hypothetical protein [Pseudomonadota bacterium]